MSAGEDTSAEDSRAEEGRSGPARRHSWLEGVPKKRVAVSGLLLDGAGRVLLLSRTYADGWVLPGGIVEQGESPIDGLRREIREEIGLNLRPRRLLCVDWVPPPRGTSLDGLVLVFEVGVLLPKEISTIRLDYGEIADYAFAGPDEWEARMDGPRIARMREVMRAYAGDSACYLDGSEPRA